MCNNSDGENSTLLTPLLCIELVMQPRRLRVSSCAGLLGSEKQKKELVPKLADLSLVGAWALTEPSNGSDASALRSTARKVSHRGS